MYYPLILIDLLSPDFHLLNILLVLRNISELQFLGRSLLRFNERAELLGNGKVQMDNGREATFWVTTTKVGNKLTLVTPQEAQKDRGTGDEL